MKKALLAALFAAVVAIPSQATQFWYDVVTNYPTGCITTNTTLWYSHPPGSGLDCVIVNRTYTSGAAVSGRRLAISGIKTEYVMRLFDAINTNATTSGSVYASFVANGNFAPSAGAGTYYATFNDLGSNPADATNGFNFRGRVFQIGNTNVFPFTNTLALTYRFGVANAANDPAQGGSASIRYVPIDMIRNVDYQVVLKYDLDNAVATMWVNPASESDTANMAVTDDLGAVATGLAGLLFRQRTGGGTVDVRDVVTGDTFADVMTNAPGLVLIATNFNAVTNYSGNPALLEAFATSIGGGPLSYQWYQIDSGGVTNLIAGANGQTYYIPSLSGSDQGNYFCAITNSGSIGALSRTNFYISVNATSTAPGFTIQPTNSSVSVGATLTLTSSAFGTGPLSFQWSINGTLLVDGAPGTGQPGDISVVSGSQTPTLTIALCSTNETANYSVTVSGAVAPPATSTNAAVTIKLPQPKTIAFLRSLLNTTTWQVTDTTTPFNVIGVITTTSNTTSGSTSSYYIQDSTDGLNLFVTGDATFRPERGDLVSAVGTLSQFNNNLEIVCNAANPYQTYTILSHGDVVPAPTVFYPGFTNNAGLMKTNMEGRFVMMTNVFFPTTGSDGLVWPSGGTVTVTNQSGMPIAVFVSSQNTNVSGQMPAFAWSILGPMVAFATGTSQPQNGPLSGYEFYITDLADVITNPPPASTGSVAFSGNNAVLTWDAVPYSYSYSVLTASDVSGPWSPLVTGLTFTNTVGTYTDVNALSGTQKFYRVATP